MAAPYNPTTLVYDGRLYVLRDLGELSAFNARTGELLYDRQKLPQGLHFTASPVGRQWQGVLSKRRRRDLRCARW